MQLDYHTECLPELVKFPAEMRMAAYKIQKSQSDSDFIGINQNDTTFCIFCNCLSEWILSKKQKKRRRGKGGTEVGVILCLVGLAPRKCGYRFEAQS